MVCFDQKKCIGCGACIRDCVGYCITLAEGKASLKDPQKNCIQCGHCVAICPVGAVHIADDTYDNGAVEPVDTMLPLLDIDVLLRTMKFRRSIRQYEKRPVPQEVLSNVLQAAHYTATGANHQRFRIVVVQKEMETFHALAWQEFSRMIAQRMEDPAFQPPGIIQRALLPENDPLHDTLFWGAPCLIVTASDNNAMWDAGMAAESMELAAVSQGLGVLFSGYLVGIINSSPALQAWLGLEGCTVKTCVLIGYPSVHYRTSVPRKYARISWR